MKRYNEIDLNLEGFDPDILSDVLNRCGCLGIQEKEDDRWTAYFPDDFDLDDLEAQLRTINPHFSAAGLQASKLEARDWNAEWKKHFRPLRIGKRLWVAPPWELPETGENEILLIIDPQMAFGTGSHETTGLMMEAVEKYIRPGNSVLDAGTGSGILAILARKLGAGDVEGFDVDPEAIDNAVHNQSLNKTAGILFQVSGEPPAGGKQYDRVLANINRGILLEMLPALQAATGRDGVLILSGLLSGDEDIIRRAVGTPFEFTERFSLNEWIALVWRKNG